MTAPLLLFCILSARQASKADPLDAAEEAAFRNAARRVAAAVVRIQTVGGVDRVGTMLAGSAPTTGVVISEDGYVISSAFNFVSKPTSIIVQLGRGRPYPARLVATDHLRMLTLLKIDVQRLPALAPAVGKGLRVGQWAIALGRTYDSPDPSVSVGIISALNRVWWKAIQTDAKVSPVNYGGPLIDIEGDPLGIIVPLSPSGKEETAGVEWYDSGIGFAIPFSDALAAAERLKGGKDLHPGLLGITVKESGIDDKPLIDVVRFNSPAERAGLRPGDVLAEMDGHSLRRRDELKQALGRKYGGDKVTITVLRKDKKISAELQLVDELVPYEPGFLGILPVRSAAKSGSGVEIRYVFAKSAAAVAGLRAGDRIRKWNGAPLQRADQLLALVRRTRPGTKVPLIVERSGTQTTVHATLTKDIDEIPHEVPLPSAASASPPSQSAESKPAETTDGNKNPKTGQYRDKLPGETAAHYWSYVPENYTPGQKWGLVVWIAPARDSMEANILSRWKVVCESRHLILAAPLPAEPTGFTPSDLLAARNVVEHFQKAYRIDSERIVVHSFASGGPFASMFAFENREIIRGLAIISGRLMGSPPDSHPSFPLRFLFSYGNQSRIWKEQYARVALVLRKMKFSVALLGTSGAGDRYLTSADVSAVAEWIDSLDRI